MVSYSEVLAQLRDYYGSAADDKLTVLYKGGTLPNEEYESLLKSAGVSYTKYVNKSTGAVRYADYKIPISETFTKPIINGGVGEIADSNTALSTAESASTLDLPAKIVSTVDEATGETTIALNTGKNAVATAANGSKVIGALGKVNAAITGAAIGTALGNLITKGLYKVNPDFWGGVNPSTINFKDYFPPVIGDFYNMYFGVNENGNGQLYAQQDDFAAIALALQQLGAFNVSSYENNLSDTSVLISPTTSDLPATYIKGNAGQEFTLFQYENKPEYYSYKDTFVIDEAEKSVYMWNNRKLPTQPDSSGKYNLTYEIIFFSEGKFSYHERRYLTDGSIINFGVKTFEPTHTTTHNGITYKWGFNNTQSYAKFDTLADLLKHVPVFSHTIWTISLNNGNWGWDAAYIINNGVEKALSDIEGMGFQDGATIPGLSGIDIKADDVIAQTIAKLKELYPSLFDNAITQKVTQPNGTEKDAVWLPVPTPDAKIDDEPVSSEGTQTKPEVKIDDEPATQTILKIIKPLPPDPDTGDGDTPPVIIPTSAANALWSIYNPTLAQIKQFGGWLWSDNFIDQLKKMFQEPAQAIIGLHKVYGTPKTGDESTIVVGYLDSGVPSKTVTKQYITVDCGAVSLPEFFGNVLDYTATEVSIFLPFVGVRQLSTADVMRSTISVKYHIDVLTGTGLAEISVRRDAAGGVLYQFSCDCAERFPISSGSYMGIVSGLVGVGAGIATAATGNLLAGGLMAANAIGNSHFDVNRTGNFSGNAGAMGGKVPYLIISRAQPAMANNFPAYQGKPTNYTTTVGACSGFIKCVVDHLENIPATADELTEIDTLLQQGILA